MVRLILNIITIGSLTFKKKYNQIRPLDVAPINCPEKSPYSSECVTHPSLCPF